MLSPENIALARKQLSEQVEKMPDGERKEAARVQLGAMSDEAISAMVEQQNKQGAAEETGKAGEQRSIFRMIVSGDVPSKKIEENKEAVAVVSIRPVSKGHVIVIPKITARDAREIPQKAMNLARNIAKRMITKLKATATEIQTSSAFDETILNVIPVYDKRVNVNSPMYEASEEELNEVYDLLKVARKKKKEVIRERKKKSQEAEVLKLKRRVP